MYWKHTRNHKGHWKATQVWLMLSSAFLYPYKTFFNAFQNGWRNSSEQLMAWSTLLKQAETVGYVHTESISAYFQCDLPPAIFPQRHWLNRCCQMESIMMAEPYWMCPEAGWRPFKLFHLYFVPSLEQCGLIDTLVFSVSIQMHKPNVGLDDLGGHFQP